MPPYKLVTKDFMKDVLSGKRRLMKVNDVRFINAPLFTEIAVKNLYDDVVKQPPMRPYFPETLPKGCQMDRQYFYNIWNTIYPD